MKITKLTILLAYLTTGTFMVTAQQNEDKQAIDRISAYLQESEKNGLTGAVLIARGDKVLYNEAFGMADKEKNVRNTTKTVFDIGSVSKQFTATAILKLEEQGKLKEEDPISKFFKNLPEDKKNITIHQLLIHSAGITQGIGNSDFDHISVNDYFKQLFATKLLHQPGQKHEYSNAGYSILARIIELVSRQSYESFLNEYLFLPAEMYHTGYLLPKWENCILAKGYNYQVINTGSMVSRYQQDGKVSRVLLGNGGINSTQEDMFKWYLALRSNKVLSKSATKKLTTPYILEFEGETSYYAYGWVIFKTPRGTNMVAHDGSNATFFYDFRWFPEEDIVILYATSSLTDSVSRIGWWVDKMFFDPTYTPKNIEVNFVSTLLDFAYHYKGAPNELASSIKMKFGDKIDKPFYLSRLGGILSRNNKLDKAIIIAELNIELFPNNSNIWDSLGQIYYSSGNKKKALKAYKKAFALDSENSYAKDMVTKLESKNR
ncbi:hypothetical protein BST83_09270 [Polaribacter filamentus]|uniref:Beta-lactamase-related domain-containing protein n=1 Tax=Polaribacter filamentus TaxID=53483 RepID=A0A2S7KXG5_9FLAO|nr:serine hydrolase domain-containing protein [Polaribacter filamentus]PQB07327.1 hypothetical protein BST83_09270 [Polaribacter filamentus]